MTRSDLRFPLATGSLVGTSPSYFSWSLRLLHLLFRQYLLVVLWFFSLSLYPEFSLFLPLFAWLRSALFFGGCRSLHFFCVFSFRSAFLTCLLLLSLLSFAILPVPPWGSLRFPSLVKGLSLSGFSSLFLLSLHVWSLGFRSYYLGSRLFLWALLPLPCAASPYCFCRPWAFPSLPHSWFLSPHSSSSPFLSAWCFLSFSCFFFS